MPSPIDTNYYNNHHVSSTLNKPPIFKGDSQEFFLWLAVLQIYLKGFRSWEEKFFVLLEFTGGEARNSISGYIISGLEGVFRTRLAQQQKKNRCFWYKLGVRFKSEQIETNL